MKIFLKMAKIQEYIKEKIKMIILKLFGEKGFRKIRTVYWTRRWKGGKYCEKEIINYLPRLVHPGDICIDVGAGFGEYTYALSKLVGPRGKVFSFEPIDYIFKILEDIVKKLKLTNVKIEKVALGDKDGELEFSIPLNDKNIPNFALAHLRTGGEIKNRTERVKVTTLDELSQKHPFLNQATFIKCDVEGRELMVFKGGENLIRKSHPIILSEIEERWTKRYGYSPEDVLNFLEKLGYQSFILLSGKLKKVKNIQDSLNNYFFIHKNLMPNFEKELL